MPPNTAQAVLTSTTLLYNHPDPPWLWCCKGTQQCQPTAPPGVSADHRAVSPSWVLCYSSSPAQLWRHLPETESQLPWQAGSAHCRYRAWCQDGGHGQGCSGGYIVSLSVLQSPAPCPDSHHRHLPVSGSEINSRLLPGSETAGSACVRCRVHLTEVPHPRDCWGHPKWGTQGFIPQPAPPLNPQCAPCMLKDCRISFPTGKKLP